MSNPISTKINPSQLQPTALNQLPSVDADKLKQGVNSNPVAKATSSENYGLNAAATLPVWLGLYKLVDKFDRACANKEDGSKTVLQKIGDFGDNIQNKISKNSAAQKIGNLIFGCKNFVKTKVIDNSSILRSIAYTPSKPTNGMVKNILNGPISEAASTAVKMIEKYTNNGKDLEKVAEFGFKDYASVVKKPDEHIKEIMSAIEKREGFVDLTKQGSFQPVRNFFGKKVHWSEVYNKMAVLKTAKPGLGNALQKTTLKSIGLITGGNAGKAALIMQAYFLADALVKGLKAPKGEKGKSTAENLVSNLGWYLTMPLGIGLMHKAGGMQYVGMSKARVAKYRNAVNEFNAKAKAGAFADKAQYDAELKAIKEMKNGKAAAKTLAEAQKAGHSVKAAKAVRWYHKPLKFAANVLTVGLEHLRGFTKPTDSKFVQDMKNLKFNMKNAAGYPVRFGLFIFAISPFLDKLLIKGCHKIFGRPTKSVLDEEKEEAAQQAQPAATAASAQQPATAPFQQAKAAQVQPTPAAVKTPAQPSSSLLKQTIAPAQAAAKAPNPFATAQAPAAKPSKPSEPVRTYIPSSAGVQITPVAGQPKDNSDKVNTALNRADAAEQEALKFLSGK